MRWYEYKMEADDLRAPDDLKARLLAMTDQLTEEEKNQPMMKVPEPAPAAPVQKAAGKKLIRFPVKQVGMLAACAAVCVVGYGALSTSSIGFAKSSAPAEYSAASVGATAPMAANYSLDTGAGTLESSADNGISTFSADDAAAAEGARSTDSAKIIYTANLSLESKDYDAARAALDAAAAEAGGYLESSSEYADSGDSRSASLSFRIPQENYESFLAAVAEAGNVTYKNQQAEDVTTQYLDVETRLDNLKNQRTRLQQLQQQADNLVQPDGCAEPDRELAEPAGLVQQSGGRVHGICGPERSQDLLAHRRQLWLPGQQRLCRGLAELCQRRAAAGCEPCRSVAGGGAGSSCRSRCCGLAKA